MCTTIVKIIYKNTGMQNVLNCQRTGIRKMSAKLFKIFPNFCKILLEQVSLDVRCWKMVNITKTNKLLI